jgi:hypothetical protein
MGQALHVSEREKGGGRNSHKTPAAAAASALLTCRRSVLQLDPSNALKITL